MKELLKTLESLKNDQTVVNCCANLCTIEKIEVLPDQSLKIHFAPIDSEFCFQVVWTNPAWLPFTR